MEVVVREEKRGVVGHDNKVERGAVGDDSRSATNIARLKADGCDIGMERFVDSASLNLPFRHKPLLKPPKKLIYTDF
uniref:Uncharacterized protein n=1 Tax=Oryza sativa subsp. japonica TaxID=39947 RepID=Q6H477_ORYSJ|nr:hypothetical protein [Oryza sativa Japonica Group]